MIRISGITKKQSRFMILLALIIPVFNVYAHEGPEDKQNERIRLKVGFTDHVPSTYYDENGTPVGIYIHVFEYIAEKENWEIEYVSSSFSDLLQRLFDGQIDMFLNMAYLDERAEKCVYHKEDIFNSWAELIVRQDSEIGSMLDLKGKRIMGITNTTFIEGVQGIRNINEWFQLDAEILSSESNEKALLAVKENRADAAVISRLGISLFTEEYGLKRSGIVFSPVRVRFGINKYLPQAQQIADAVDRHIIQMKDDSDSEYYRAYEIHLGRSSSLVFSVPQWVKLTLYIGSPLILLILGNVVILQWQVRKKTRELKKVNKELENDIVQRELTENTLREREKQFRDLVEKAKIAISMNNLDGRIIYANDINAKLYGYTREEMQKKCIRDLVHPDDYERVIGNHKERLEGIAPQRYEFRGIRKDGNIIVLEVDGALIEEDGKVIGVRNYFWDISDRRRAEEERNKLEEQLFHAQKMESIGRLAGGIAHDFNNILAAIMTNADALSFQYNDETTPLGRSLKSIVESTERASDLTKQLLGLARKGRSNPVPLDLNIIINDTLRMSEKIFERKVDVVTDLDVNIESIEADKNQINQVLTNILINAKDAMPSGGKISIKTQNELLDDEGSIFHPDIKKGKYIKVSISDTGIGMPKDVKDKLYEPFFTTKGEAGLGLGMATVYGIVKNHNGFIDVYSEPGEGTIFELYFPASEKEVPISDVIPKPVTGEGTILLVDDEELLRITTKKALTELGYTVITATDGIECVDAFRKNADKIDLVLLDMIMPNMNGVEAFNELKKIKSDVKVFIMSGFSQDEKSSEVLSKGALGFIQKPARLFELTRIISDTLNK
ncbi:MAG: PAS domain S-box protein [bacterium]|nr:PAS domain S-box protein [bacterium]